MAAAAEIPQWKKDLIARLRVQNKIHSSGTVSNEQQMYSPSLAFLGHQPGISNSCSSGAVANGRSSNKKMVQEKAWDHYASDSTEFVSENDYSRSSDSESSEDLHYGPGIVNKLKNKYQSLTSRTNHVAKSRSIINLINMRKATSLENILDEEPPKLRQHQTESITYRKDLKRARSMEVISQIIPDNKPKRESMHEGLLKLDKVIRPNRPKRITPVMDEREKPPVDVVKQAKMIFEKRPESRTKPPKATGEVAAKVASYKNIITQAKTVRKPVVKIKPPNLTIDKNPLNRKVGTEIKRTFKELSETTKSVTKKADISDISIIEHSGPNAIPDLILTLTPILTPKGGDLKSEVIETRNSVVFNFAERKKSVPYEPKVNGSKPISAEEKVSERVVEKNLKNAAKNLQENGVRCEDLGPGVIRLPKKKRSPKEPESNSVVFKFTDRKDVPDYVGNDLSRTVPKLEKPKVGEGGIILLSGASLDESFTDEDEEVMQYLKAPPSPCLVTFVNDNVLIDGKSSLSSKNKKIRMSISFVDAGPDVFEYPSESSLLLDDSPTSPNAANLGHTVPLLTGSTLSNYTPKTTETFQPGITRTVPTETKPSIDVTDTAIEKPILEETEEPVLFSAGTNSDILF